MNGKGVSSIYEAIKEMELLPLHSRYENFFSFDTLEKIREYFTFKPDKTKKVEKVAVPGKIYKELHLLFEEFNSYLNGKESTEKIEKKYNEDLLKCRDFFQFWISHNKRKNVTKWMMSIDEFLPVKSQMEVNRNYLSLINLIILKQLLNKNPDPKKINIIFDELLISKPITNIFEKHTNGSSIHQKIELMKTMLLKFSMGQTESKSKKSKEFIKPQQENIISEIKVLLDDKNVHNFIRVNVFEGVTYFNKERFEELISWVMLFNFIATTNSVISEKRKRSLNITELNREINKSIKAKADEFINLVTKAENSGYDFNKFNEEIIETQNLKTKKTKKQK
jgi:hypothetical protein